MATGPLGVVRVGRDDIASSVGALLANNRAFSSTNANTTASPEARFKATLAYALSIVGDREIRAALWATPPTPQYRGSGAVERGVAAHAVRVLRAAGMADSAGILTTWNDAARIRGFWGVAHQIERELQEIQGAVP